MSTLTVSNTLGGTFGVVATNNIVFDFTSSWNTNTSGSGNTSGGGAGGGASSNTITYWYQIKTKCEPRACGLFPIDDGCAEPSRMVIMVMARNLVELCDKINTYNIVGKIESIKRFSTPAYSQDRAFAEDYDPDCNQLIDVTEDLVSIGNACSSYFLDFDDLIADASSEMSLEPIDFGLDSVASFTMSGAFNPTLVRNESTHYLMPFGGSVSFGGGSSLSLLINDFIAPFTGGPTFSGQLSPKTTYKVTFGGTLSFGGRFEQTNVDEEVSADVDSDMEILYLKANYGIIDAGDLTSSASSFVQTDCCSDSNTPLVLELTHNLDKANVLSQFLLRNGYRLDNPVKITYNTITKLWQGNQNFVGRTTSADNQLHAWNLIFEFGCISDATSLLGGLDNQKIWKLSINIFSKNRTNSTDFNSKIVLFYANDTVCRNSIPVSFSSSLNVITKVATPPSAQLMPVLYDEIGLFKSKYWQSNPDLLLNVFKIAPLSPTVVTYPEITLPISDVRGQYVLN